MSTSPLTALRGIPPAATWRTVRCQVPSRCCRGDRVGQVGAAADISTLPSEAISSGSCPASAAGHSQSGRTIATDCCGLKAFDCCARIGQHAGAVAAVVLPANGTCLYKANGTLVPDSAGAIVLTLPPAPPPAPPSGSGVVWSGSQQQYLGRNCDISAWQVCQHPY